MGTEAIAVQGLSRGHLTKEEPQNWGYGPLKTREHFCSDCGARVTVSTDGEKEYGHQRNCEHKIDRTLGTSGYGGWAIDG